MRIAFILPRPARTGPVNMVAHLVRELGAEHDLHVVFLAPARAGDEAPQFEGAATVYRAASLRGIPAWMAALAHLRRLRADICSVHGWFPTLLAAIMCPERSIGTVHHAPREYYRHRLGPAGALFAWVEARAFARLAQTVACSEHARRALAARVPGTLVIHNGVEERTFRPRCAPERAELRRRYGLSESARICVVLGNLDRRKQPDHVVRAFASLELGERAMLCLVGEGPLAAAIDGLASAQPNVLRVGRSGNPADWLGLADLFVSFARSEGLPLAVLEALSSGLPCILSDIAPHRELARYAESEQLCFVALDDTASLKAELATRLGLPARRFRAADVGAARMGRAYARAFGRIAPRPELPA